jgi:hypothetical protein
MSQVGTRHFESIPTWETPKPLAANFFISFLALDKAPKKALEP